MGNGDRAAARVGIERADVSLSAPARPLRQPLQSQPPCLLNNMHALTTTSPNVVIYSSVISACAKGGGQVEVVLELLREMEARGIEKNEFTYSAAISCCDKALNTELALE